MALTAAQLTTLKNDIAADPTLSTIPQTADGAFEVAAAYNLLASPTFTVWRTSVLTSEAKQAMVWTEYIGRSVAERDAWQFMLSNGEINAADINVRQGIQDIFSGPQAATTRSNLVALGQRSAKRAETLFATGSGTGGNVATLTFEGNLSYRDVLDAWAV